MALCRASSRMEAVELFRANALSAFASRDVRKIGSTKFADLGGPAVALGEVLVRDAYGEGSWSPAG